LTEFIELIGFIAPVKSTSLISNEIFNGVKIWDFKRIYFLIYIWAKKGKN